MRLSGENEAISLSLYHICSHFIFSMMLLCEVQWRLLLIFLLLCTNRGSLLLLSGPTCKSSRFFFNKESRGGKKGKESPSELNEVLVADWDWFICWFLNDVRFENFILAWLCFTSLHNYISLVINWYFLVWWVGTWQTNKLWSLKLYNSATKVRSWDFILNLVVGAPRRVIAYCSLIVRLVQFLAMVFPSNVMLYMFFCRYFFFRGGLYLDQM